MYGISHRTVASNNLRIHRGHLIIEYREPIDWINSIPVAPLLAIHDDLVLLVRHNQFLHFLRRVLITTNDV